MRLRANQDGRGLHESCFNFAICRMNPSPAKLMVAVFATTVCIKINGRADFTLSMDLKKLIGEFWTKGYNHFIFELQDCLTMDSTFLGVLSGIGLKFSGGENVQVGAPLELFNPNSRIAETLENLGVVDLFSVKHGSPPVSGLFEPLPQTSGSTQAELTQNCLEAHETLIAIHPENVQKFKDVTQLLSDNLKRSEAGGDA
jgi:anti-anti-sigma regulatory factor